MKDSTISFSLVSVREIEGATAINRRALRRLGRTPVSVDMNVRVVPDVDRSLVSLVVSCSYIAVIGYLRTRVLACSVVATFEIPELADYVSAKGDDVVLGSSLMRSMLNITVGALRGVIAVRTAGTVLRFRPLPILDLNALMYRLHYGESVADDMIR